MQQKYMPEKKLKKQPLRNFIKIVSEGKFYEIPKIIKRRILNSLKAIRRLYLWVIGTYDESTSSRQRLRRRLPSLLYKTYGVPASASTSNQITIAIIARDGDSYPKSSAFIRLISPLTHPLLRDNVRIRLYPENTTSVDADVGLCIVQRNAFDHPADAKELIDNLRLLKMALVVDTDDAFSLIDPSHPEHSVHTPTIDAFNYLVKHADQVWVSTPILKRIVGGRKTYVIQNALDDRVWNTYIRNTRLDGPIEMVYMGTVSHDADLEMIIPALQKVDDKFPGSFRLTIIGVSSNLPPAPWLRRIHQKNSIYPKFVKWFLRQGPFDIGLSPLVDNDFNQAKSDIKCLDYLAASILPVVSDVNPYRTTELKEYIVRVKNSPTNWERTLADIVKDPRSFRIKSASIVESGQNYVWQKRSSRQAAQQIQKQLQVLLPKL